MQSVVLTLALLMITAKVKLWNSLIKKPSLKVLGGTIGPHMNVIFQYHSGFSSDRINLSPFTKDFRGVDLFEY